MAVPIPVSVGWGSGQATGDGGLVFGEKRVGFAKDPEKLELTTDSGGVALANARLIRLPDCFSDKHCLEVEFYPSPSNAKTSGKTPCRKR
jgi:hypothetical protein